MTTSEPDNLRTEYAPCSHWPATDGRSSRSWLGADERLELARCHNVQRRRQWLAGRWTSKQLIRREIDARPWAFRKCGDLADIQILTRDTHGRGARPRLFIDGQENPWALSISHGERGVLVALAAGDDCSLGVDLVNETAPTAGFLRLWFTPDEQRWIAADPPRRTALLWAMKEAFYKACQTGQSWSPRDFEVRTQDRIEALDCNHWTCVGWGQLLRPQWTDVFAIDGHIAAVVCVSRPSKRVTTASGPAHGARRELPAGALAIGPDARPPHGTRVRRFESPDS